jgi:hypothetical protein
MKEQPNSAFYKVVDMFGNETLMPVPQKKQDKNLFTDYDGFVEKFEPKKTTDDCYTPEDVYKVVLDFVAKSYPLEGKQIIRPFFPGGDFQAIEYTPDCVVIDNPPFSIISKIAKFYIKNEVPFFLFAPHLTLFSPDLDCTHIVADATIIYENGANVKTSFLSNMFGDAKIIADADFTAAFKEIEARQKVNLPKYEYPDNVLTVSAVAWIVSRGISLRIDKNQTKHCRALASQKSIGKSIFGSGFLISDEAAAEKAAAEKAAAEKAAAEKDNVIIWELSEKERAIIKQLAKTKKP